MQHSRGGGGNNQHPYGRVRSGGSRVPIDDELVPMKHISTKTPSKPLSQEKLLAQLVRSQRFATAWAFVSMLLVIGIGSALIVAGFAVQASGDMMTKTSEATVSMHDETLQTKADVTNYIAQLKSNFPAGQDVETARQLLGIVENAHKISSGVSLLLENVQPETVTELSGHVGTIVSKVDMLFAQVSQEEMTRIKVLFDHMQELVAGVTPAHVTKLMDGVSETAKHVGEMSKEAEQSHLVQHGSQFLDQAKNTMEHLNGGQGLALGWGAAQAVPVPLQLPHPTPDSRKK